MTNWKTRATTALAALMIGSTAFAGAPMPQKIIATLDGTQSFGNTRRAISFYETTTLDATAHDAFGTTPLFTVWTGYEDSLGNNFEDIDTFTVNPVNGTVYAVAFDSGAAGVVDAAGDTQGDLDIYRIDYQEILKDFVTNGRAKGTMYAPSIGPDGDLNPQHPDHSGTTINLASAIQKVGEVGRTQGSSFFDRDVEFINPQTLVLIDNEQDSSDTAAQDHELRVLERVSMTAGGASPNTSDSNSIEGGYNAQTTESWEADRLALLNMDFVSGVPTGFSEPEDIALARSSNGVIVGVWVAETDGGGDDLSFFEISNIGNPSADDATAAISTIELLGNSRSLDENPELDPNTNDGDHDFIKVDNEGNVLIGESGFFDTTPGGESGSGGSPSGEPTIQRLNVDDYLAGNVDLSSDAWDDLGGGGAHEGLGSTSSDTAGDSSVAPVQLEGPLGSLSNAFTGGSGLSLDDDTNVTDGRFATLQQGAKVDLNNDGDYNDTVNGQPETITNEVLFLFDIDSGSAPGVIADVYVIDLETGKIIYEELNATNHFLIEHGIRSFTRGDTDGDGDVDADDIDNFTAQDTGDALNEEMYDLTGDMALDAIGGPSNAEDMNELIREILGTEYGDANLDGLVNSADLSILAANFGGSGKGWATADLNGDDIVNSADLSILAAFFGFNNMAAPGEIGLSTAALLELADSWGIEFGVAAVPAPAGLPAGLALIAMMGMRRRCRA